VVDGAGLDRSSGTTMRTLIMDQFTEIMDQFTDDYLDVKQLRGRLT
jgi:hypothetical protein